jgi:hypothetical protein
VCVCVCPSVRIVWCNAFGCVRGDRGAVGSQKAADRRKAREDALSTVIGFRKVIDHVSSSGAVVVGHNCMMDLLHTTDKFFHLLPMVCERPVLAALLSRDVCIAVLSQ